jgi:hypothetical protein
LVLKQRLKRRAPSGRKRLDPQGALKAVAWMIGRIEECVDLGDGHSFLRLSCLDDFVAGAYHALLQHAEVEARPSAGCQQGRHAWFVHANADAITGNARLSDLEQCGADAIAVTDAHGIVGQAFDREILAELSVDEAGSLQLLLPIAIGFDLVDEDGALLTAVSGEVALTVAVQIQPAGPATAGDRILPDRSVHRATLPLDVARKSDIHRQETSHNSILVMLGGGWNRVQQTDVMGGTNRSPCEGSKL